jgi:hypothetical protein
MPNRRQDYPEYEEVMGERVVLAALDTAQLLDAMVSKQEMIKFVNQLPDDETEEAE